MLHVNKQNDYSTRILHTLWCLITLPLSIKHLRHSRAFETAKFVTSSHKYAQPSNGWVLLATELYGMRMRLLRFFPSSDFLFSFSCTSHLRTNFRYLEVPFSCAFPSSSYSPSSLACDCVSVTFPLFRIFIFLFPTQRARFRSYAGNISKRNNKVMRKLSCLCSRGL